MTERTRSRSFLVSTAILAILAVAAVVVPDQLSDDGPDTVQVGFVGVPEARSRATLLAATAGAGATAGVRSFGDRATAESALRAEKVDLLLVGADALVLRGEGTSGRIRGLAGTIGRALAASSDLEDAGVAPGLISKLLEGRSLPISSLIPVDPDREASQGVLVLATAVLFMSLLTYGGWVGMGVVAEKSSRVVEVILATIRPTELLAGKIIGIGLVGLAQLVVVAGSALAAAMARGGDLPVVTPGPLALILLWFVLGYSFYSCAFAAVGASVTRQEDAQTALGPVTMLLTIAYFIGIGATTSPDAGWSRLVSFVPPLAPMTMPARAILSDTAWWELPVAVMSTIVATYGLVRLSGRLYTGAILRFGPRIRLRDAWRDGRKDPTVRTQLQP